MQAFEIIDRNDATFTKTIDRARLVVSISRAQRNGAYSVQIPSRARYDRLAIAELAFGMALAALPVGMAIYGLFL